MKHKSLVKLKKQTEIEKIKAQKSMIDHDSPRHFLEDYMLNDPVCLYKWTWSTIRLWEGTTNSCHRVKSDPIPENYEDFHNTPRKIADREKMLAGQWPGGGCEYCRDIERAGGESDRTMMNSAPPSRVYPKELDKNKYETNLTPKMVEVYFNNLCNLGCVYCSAEYSTVWEVENKKHNPIIELEHTGHVSPATSNRQLYLDRVEKHFEWLKKNHKDIKRYNVLGGEPFFQPEFERNVDFFLDNPSPDLDFTIFTNLKVKPDKMRRILDKAKLCMDKKHLRQFGMVFSLDCWGPQQEYTRSGINLQDWETNFNIVLNEYPDFKLMIHSTIVSLGLPTLPDLLRKVVEWKKKRNVGISFSIADGRESMHPGIWSNNIMDQYWRSAIDLVSGAERQALIGLRGVSIIKQENKDLQKELFSILDQLDVRRNTNWRETFDWLRKIENGV